MTTPPGGKPSFSDVKSGSSTAPETPEARMARLSVAPKVDFSSLSNMDPAQRAKEAADFASNFMNHGELIVTATIPFIATSVLPSDILLRTKGGTPKNHVNYIECNNARPDQTTTHKTLCRGQRIVHEETKIGADFGPDSVNPEFEGLGGGIVNGGFYKKFANPIHGACSPDTNVEGKPVVRHYDPSQQNAANTNGMFIHSLLDAHNIPLDKLRARRCAVDNLEAVALKEAAEGTDRKAEDGRIEVLEGHEVTVEFDWVNAAATTPEARKKPQCALPKGATPAHPWIVVTRKKHDLVTKKYEELAQIYSAKKKVIDAEWLGEKPKPKAKADKLTDPDKKPPTGAHDGDLAKLEKARQAKVAEENKGTAARERALGLPASGGRELPGVAPSEPSRGRVQAVENARNPPQTEEQRVAADRAQSDANKRQARNQIQRDYAVAENNAQRIKRARQADQIAGQWSKITAGYEQLTTLTEVVKAWRVKPMEIRVEAQGCAGAQDLTLGVYPRKRFGVDLLKLKEVVEAAATVKAVITNFRSYLEKIKGFQLELSAFEMVELPTSSEGPKAKIVFMNVPTASVAFEYRELTRDSDPKNGETAGLKKTQVQRAYMLEVGIGTVIGVAVTLAIPLVRFAPAIGELGNLLLKLAHVDLDFTIKIDIGVGVQGTFEYDEYGKFGNGAVTLEPRALFFIGFVFKAGDFAKASGGIQGGCKIPFKCFADANGMYFDRLASSVKLDFIWTAEVNLFGWHKTGDTYPITSFPVVASRMSVFKV